MIFKPRWYNLLPNICKPSKKFIKKLEDLRVRHHVPHEVFDVLIMSSPHSICKLQKMVYESLKSNFPHMPEKLIFASMLDAWLSEHSNQIELSEDEIEEALEDINSLKDLCNYLTVLEWEINDKYMTLGFDFVPELIDEIDSILAQDKDIVGKEWTLEDYYKYFNANEREITSLLRQKRPILSFILFILLLTGIFSFTKAIISLIKGDIISMIGGLLSALFVGGIWFILHSWAIKHTKYR